MILATNFFVSLSLFKDVGLTLKIITEARNGTVAEAGGLQRVQGKSELQNESLSQKN